MINKIAIILAVIAAIAAAALFAGEMDFSPANTNVVAITINEDGSANSWTVGDLLTALQLQNRRYHREVKTPAGRVAWHGRLVSQTIDTNRLEKVEVYEDGATFTFPFEPKTVERPKTTVNAFGVPKRLAELRAKRAAEKETTNTVTVVIKTGEIAEE